MAIKIRIIFKKMFIPKAALIEIFKISFLFSKNKSFFEKKFQTLKNYMLLKLCEFHEKVYDWCFFD